MIKELTTPLLAISLSGISAVASLVAPIIGCVGVILGCIASIYAIQHHRLEINRRRKIIEIAKSLQDDISNKD